MFLGTVSTSSTSLPIPTRTPLLMHRILLASAALAAPFLLAAPAHADEGMWTFDAFPAATMMKDYGWAPDQKWLDRVRASAVRLTGGCSASFVSPDGLILTNHHCVVECAQNLSTQQADLVANGFIAARREEERKCPGQQAEVVTAITDVTADVKGAIGALAGEALVKARDAKIAEIEKAGCKDTATTRCQVVTLFGGGQYKLYTYRKYSDVRLVWAPEFQAAFFGGDPDNFNYPRYALDASFLRAYENGKPVKVAAFLKWQSGFHAAPVHVRPTGFPACGFAAAEQPRAVRTARTPAFGDGAERRTQARGRRYPVRHREHAQGLYRARAGAERSGFRQGAGR